MVGARDGQIALYNCTNHFKLISTIRLEELGVEGEDEDTCMQYI